MVYMILFYLLSGWEPEIKISDSPGNYVHIYEGNVLALDKNNGVFVVWVKESLPYHFIYFSRSLDGGMSFESQKKVFPFDASSPNISADQNGILYLAFTQYIGGNYYTVLYKSTDRGETWNNVSTIGFGNCLYMFVDEENIIHCLYTGNDLGYNVTLAYARSIDGGITWHKNILNTSTQLSSIVFFQFIKDKFGNLHLVCLRDTTSTLSGNIYYKRGLNNGNQWEPFIKLNQITQRATVPKIAVDSVNNVYVTWGIHPGFGSPNYRGKLFVAKSTNGGQNFSQEVIANGLIDSLRSSFNHYISFDGEKLVLFNIWKYDTQLRLYLAKSVDGINWSEDTFLTPSYPYPKGPGTPFTITKRDTYHLVFLNTPIGGEILDDDIYYKRYVKTPVNSKERFTLSFYNFSKEESIVYSIDGRKISFYQRNLKRGIYFGKFKRKSLKILKIK